MISLIVLEAMGLGGIIGIVVGVLAFFLIVGGIIEYKRNHPNGGGGNNYISPSTYVPPATPSEEQVKATLKPLNDAIAALEAKRKELEDSIAQNQDENSQLTLDIAELEKQLDQLSDVHSRAVIANAAANVDPLEINELVVMPQMENLSQLLVKIENEYPEIKADLATIAWKRIWLPQMQKLIPRVIKAKADELIKQGKIGSAAEMPEGGIYRLILKKDKNICYVGQAVNFKDRWYQHVKCMVGVTAAGGQLLYNHQPDEFY